MKPVVLSDLETHLVTRHGVNPELVSELEERYPDKREQVAASSHALMHMMGTDGGELTHEHPEFEANSGTGISLIDDDQIAMAIKAPSDDELVENKRRFIETFGQEKWDEMMAAIDTAVTPQIRTDATRRRLTTVKEQPEGDDG